MRLRRRVLWSVFGDSLPSLRTDHDLQKLREAGYPIAPFARALTLRKSHDIFESGVEAMFRELNVFPQLASTTLEHLQQVLEQTSGLLLDIILGKFSGLDFFRSMPKDEIATFSRLVLNSSLTGIPLQLVSSTCPDYVPRSYLLNGGVGLFAERTMNSVDNLKAFFDRHGLAFQLEMHLADGDAVDPSALLATGETQKTFTEKISSSIRHIQHELMQRGMSHYVSVMPMSDVFGDLSTYGEAHTYYTEQLRAQYEQGSKRVASAIKSLMSERVQLGDFEAIPDDRARLELVIGELAGYTTYGRQIAGQALIISPGASSVVPAYNFGAERVQVNPVVYVYESKTSRSY